ncbi:Protein DETOXIFICATION 33 [Linum perenne]
MSTMEAPLLQPRTGKRSLVSSVGISDFRDESRTLWKIAGPAIFTSIAQYSLGALTQTFTGRLGEMELAAVSVENSVIAGLAFGVMMGMGSALETLCGQAYGAGQIRMLGIYMQRSWVILLVTAFLLVPLYVWAPPILEFLGETSEISDAAGKFAIWMLPQLFAYAMNFPIQKFLQAQSKVKVMAWISAVVLVLHIFFSWLLILKLGWGLVGAAIVLNASWWVIIIAQIGYIFITNSDGAWNGFSWLAFSDLWGFVKLSLASAVMLCVRVSNELGKGNARAAKISVIVVSATSIVIGVVCMILVFTTRGSFPELFTSSEAVAEETRRLAGLLAFTFLLNSLQPVLSGVAIGAGWQSLVAYINIFCYYIVGLPAGILFGFNFDFGVEGIWSGMIGGIVMQTIILVVITSITNWDSEAEKAESRVKRWGGSPGQY